VSKTAGQNATLTVTPSGAGPFSYQWSKGGVNLSNGGNVSGATTSALTLSSVSAPDAGTYTVKVTEQAGSFCSGAVQGTLAVTTSVAPSSLSFNYAAPTLTLSWSAGVLQTNGTLLGTGNAWGDLPGATSPYPVTPSNTRMFYRLRGQ
jgi:hypothetical protein